MIEKAFKVVSMEQRRKESERERRKADRERSEREFVECVNTIQDALQKTGADRMTLSFLFLHLSMMLYEGSFDDIGNIRAIRTDRKAKGGAIV